MKRLPLFIILSFPLLFPPAAPQAASTTHGTAAYLVLLGQVTTGGAPDALAIDRGGGASDVLFMDQNGKIGFIDGDELSLQPDQVLLPNEGSHSWLAYDRLTAQVYALSLETQWADLEHYWTRAQLAVLRQRSKIGTIQVNAAYNTNPASLADRLYTVNGMAIRSPGVEGAENGRIILDDTAGGVLDVVDLDPGGTSAQRLQRYTYRSPITEDIVYRMAGNSLALETNHQTLPVDDLSTTDVLYISDQNNSNGYTLRAIQLAHPLQDLNPQVLAPINLSNPNRCGIGGCKGLALAEPLDRLWIASGDQRFSQGYLDYVDTPTAAPSTTWLTYGDESFMVTDWYDPHRTFVVTYDQYGNDPTHALYLHLLYDSTVIDSLKLMDSYDPTRPIRDMAFDPYSRRLFLAINDQVVAVQVLAGAPPAPLPPVQSIWTVGSMGGSLTTPKEKARLDFFPGAVSATSQVTYTEILPYINLEYHRNIRCFSLIVALLSSRAPATDFGAPVVVTLKYSDLELGAGQESTLQLYRQDGAAWTPLPSEVNASQNTLRATLSQDGVYAALAESSWVYLPFIRP